MSESKMENGSDAAILKNDGRALAGGIRLFIPRSPPPLY